MIEFLTFEQIMVSTCDLGETAVVVVDCMLNSLALK